MNKAQTIERKPDFLFLGYAPFPLIAVPGFLLIYLGYRLGQDDYPLFLTVGPMIVGALLQFSFKVFEIDYPNKKIRFPVQYLFFKLGKWESISDYTHIILRSDHNKYGMWSGNTGIKTQVFEKRYVVELKKADPKAPGLRLYTGKTIANAKKKLDDYADMLQIEKKNYIQEGWARARSRSRRKMRR